MKITEYPRISQLQADQVLLVDGVNGTKTIPIGDTYFAMLDTFATAELRSRKFRGKNLGTAITEEQKARIQDGSFKGFFLGDYWKIGGRIWRIVDFDYWLHCGDTTFKTHHLVIMPDNILYNAQMNPTDTTAGGYVGSEMYTSGLNQAKTIVAAAFGDAVLTHREPLTNAVTNGYPSAGAWYDSSVELPNEIMMYGSYVFVPASDGSIIPHRYTIDKKQLALAAIAPEYVNICANYWLRDVVSSAQFAFVDAGGGTSYSTASFPFGVRPIFPIG